MKASEEYLSNFWMNKESIANISKEIRKAQTEAYNQAIDDAAENCTTELTSTCIRVDKQSILNLKK